MNNANASGIKGAKITTFDAATCRSLSERVEAALAPLAEELGISFRARGGQYLGGSFTLKLEAAVKTADGGVASREAQAFTMFAERYGLRPEMLGQKFRQGGREFTVTGLNTKAARLPVIATDAEGRGYKFTAADVARALGSPSPSRAIPVAPVNG